MLLENKVVVVSGIGPGLGVKLAVEAAREGARGIVALARTAENWRMPSVGCVNWAPPARC